MFDESSRYFSDRPGGPPVVEVTDRRGRTVKAVTTPDRPSQSLLGTHVLREGERVDHLAFRYLEDGTAAWRISEFNDAMVPESLSEQEQIPIPNPFR